MREMRAPDGRLEFACFSIFRSLLPIAEYRRCPAVTCSEQQIEHWPSFHSLRIFRAPEQFNRSPSCQAARSMTGPSAASFNHHEALAASITAQNIAHQADQVVWLCNITHTEQLQPVVTCEELCFCPMLLVGESNLYNPSFRFNLPLLAAYPCQVMSRIPFGSRHMLQPYVAS